MVFIVHPGRSNLVSRSPNVRRKWLFQTSLKICACACVSVQECMWERGFSMNWMDNPWARLELGTERVCWKEIKKGWKCLWALSVAHRNEMKYLCCVEIDTSPTSRKLTLAFLLGLWDGKYWKCGTFRAGQSVMATPSPACDSFAIGHSFAANISHPQRNTACFKICR